MKVIQMENDSYMLVLSTDSYVYFSSFEVSHKPLSVKLFVSGSGVQHASFLYEQAQAFCKAWREFQCKN